MMRVLVTGGAGYIGAHVVVDLLSAGHEVIVVDDLSTGFEEAVRRAQELAGRSCTFIRADIGDLPTMQTALRGVDAVLHFAAFKMVGESMEAPERYFHNNLGGMATLLRAMQDAGVHRIVYSSSAAVYGTQPGQGAIPESAHLVPDSPYGTTKVQGEQLLAWMVQRRAWSAVSLRYFNPVGAHPSGHIGQPPDDAASLLPRALQAITDPRARLAIYGSDYPTPDGTCLRDYIHVCDLSRAHLVALGALDRSEHSIFNVGTGHAHSVREVIAACERVTGLPLPCDDAPRRAGDVPVSVADPTRFREVMGFEAKRSLDEMVASAWRWSCEHPRGYR